MLIESLLKAIARLLELRTETQRQYSPGGCGLFQPELENRRHRDQAKQSVVLFALQNEQWYLPHRIESPFSLKDKFRRYHQRQLQNVPCCLAQNNREAAGKPRGNRYPDAVEDRRCSPSGIQVSPLQRGPGPVGWTPNQTLRELVLTVGLPGDADLLEAFADLWTKQSLKLMPFAKGFIYAR